MRPPTSDLEFDSRAIVGLAGRPGCNCLPLLNLRDSINTKRSTFLKAARARRKRYRRSWTLGRVVGGIRRYGVMAAADCLAVGTTYALAVALRTGAPPEVLEPQVAPLSIGVAFGAGVLQVLGNLVFAVYWRDWTAASLEDMVALAKSTTLVVVGLLAFNLGTDAHWIPTGAVLAGGSLSLFVQAALHLRPRWPQILRAAFGRSAAAESLIVVGAGRVGQLLAADVVGGGRDYRIACFVDDDPRKTGSYLRGIRVAGRVSDLPELIDWHGASTIVIAMANPPAGFIRRVIEICEGSDVRVRRVRGFSLLRADTAPIEPIGIEELLAREPVDLSGRAMQEHYAGRRILITGAAGSIGSELARQLVRLSPAQLFLLDNNESGLHDVYQSLADDAAEIVLGDIRDRRWLEHCFRRIRPEVVFHAAAYKHVPILERTPMQGLSTNVIGTANVLQVSNALRVERFVFVSTDKAVEPSSVLGYTKLFGEYLTIAYARRDTRNYASVRFGNVLGSAGSAVPLFTSQIDHGGPITVTHPEATRYFMTIEEAVGLLIEAGAIATAADVLVLDMGQPILIAELAQRMVRLRGLRTPGDIDIRYIGLRPGEKLHERLVSSEEHAVGTSHPRIMRVHNANVPSAEVLESALRAIEDRVNQQDEYGGIELLTAVIGVDRRAPATSVPHGWPN
jgi:FlaA1/EpsC-like NDP-sugar epimerase